MVVYMITDYRLQFFKAKKYKFRAYYIYIYKYIYSK